MGFWSELKEAVSNPGQAVSDFGSAVDDAITQPIIGGLSDVASGIDDSILQPITGGLSDVASGIDDSILQPITGGLSDLGSSIGNAVSDVGSWVDDNVIKPIKKDPVKFIVVAAAYAYGIPGLEFAGAGTAAATGIASGAYALAQGKDFDAAVKDGLTTAAFTQAGNYVKNEYFNGTPTTTPKTSPLDVGGGAPPDLRYGFDPNQITDLPPVNSAPYVDPTQAQNPFAPKMPSQLDLRMDLNDVNIRDLPGNSNYSTPEIPSSNSQMNADQLGNDVYRSSVSDLTSEKPYVPGSGNQPQVGTPEHWEVDPNNPNSRIKIPASEDYLPEVVDYSRAAEPMTGNNYWDMAKNAGSIALETAIAHPWLVGGGLLLADQLFNDGSVTKGIVNTGKTIIDKFTNDDKHDDGTKTDDGGGVKKIGDPSFYEKLQQLSMSQNYDPYKDDIYKYGQTRGEHKFLSDPVYTPVSYADGGFVDPMQRQYQSPAVGPMMAPQQMQTQQPMGALSQVNAMSNQPSPIGPSLGRPQVPRQMPGRGALQQVSQQQQNPDYRYFSYGQIPASIGSPMQQPQGRATGGLAMAHGGNVSDGRTDDIPAMLSKGEYVMDAETVALLGNGNNDAGAKQLDHMREAVRKQKGGALSKGRISPDAQSPLAYLSRRMA